MTKGWTDIIARAKLAKVYDLLAKKDAPKKETDLELLFEELFEACESVSPSMLTMASRFSDPDYIDNKLRRIYFAYCMIKAFRDPEFSRVDYNRALWFLGKKKRAL
jgi:hypothetical protein